MRRAVVIDIGGVEKESHRLKGLASLKAGGYTYISTGVSCGVECPVSPKQFKANTALRAELDFENPFL